MAKILVVAAWLLVPPVVRAQASSPSPGPTPPAYADSVQVTASRIPEATLDVPASIQVITARELRDRGATDLKSALALAAGVDIAPGGDGGPAASVPEFWGLREFDAFLLVVDGVPWGGAFNPALATLDLNDVDHVEVQRGPAPVMYGATSFVGVIQVVRRPPGEKGARLSASGGSYGTGGVAVATRVPTGAGLESSLSADFRREGFPDERTSYKKGHLLWRSRRTSGASVVSFDLEGTFLRQEPASPTPRQGPALSTAVPLDSNQNPRGAHLDENRFFARLGMDRTLASASWSTVLSLTHSGQDQLRGFLTDLSNADPNAAGFRADIATNDLYFDTHLAWTRFHGWRAVVGVDYLFGKADAKGDRFDYGVRLDGRGAPSSLPLGEERALADTRNFFGFYGNLEWTPAESLRVDLGARLNRTSEERGEGEAEEAAGGREDKRDVTRLSGGVGVTYTAWSRGEDRVSAFASWKNAFKPAAIDFNLAEVEPAGGEGILKPETANSYEAGVKGELCGHRVRLELSGFLSDFKNLVIAQSVGGLPSLTNAGAIRLKGLEVSATGQVIPHLFARAAYSLHDSRFRDYLTEFDGVPTQLQGKRFEMAPQHLGALALSWAPEHGLFASGELRYVGSRYLNKRNTALASHYATLMAMVGYRHGRYELRATGRNLTDRRDPVAESELGDAQYYRLFPRRVDVAGTVRF